MPGRRPSSCSICQSNGQNSKRNSKRPEKPNPSRRHQKNRLPSMDGRCSLTPHRQKSNATNAEQHYNYYFFQYFILKSCKSLSKHHSGHLNSGSL